jgi:uncharacterized protein YecE (DUF72 family)
MSVKITQKIAHKKVIDRCQELNCSLIEPFVYSTANKTRLKLKCNIDGYGSNGEWNPTYASFIMSGHGCNACAIKKNSDKLRKSQKEVNENIQKRLKEINASLLEPFVYKTNQSIVNLKCNIDGHEWDVSYYCFVNVKSGCPRCSGQILYKEEAEENLNKKLIKINASLIEPFIYKNNNSIVKFKCNIDGHKRELTYHSFVYNDNGCPRCSNRIVYIEEALDNVNRRLKEINASLREPFVYKTNKSKIKLKCNVDGHKWAPKYSNLVNNNEGCAKCAGVLKLTQEEAEKNVLNQCKIMNYELVEPFIYSGTASTKLLLKCNDCGCIWPVNYNNFLSIKSGCPRCAASKGEREIENILKEKNISYIAEKTFNECKYINCLKFDFYLTEMNKCIEFDGIQHFESFDFFGGEEGLKELQKRDKIKNQYCKNNNIDLIRIPYWDFNKIEQILLNVM